jgi:SAM-dependent methyltransferase
VTESNVSHEPVAPERPIEAGWLALREAADARARDVAAPVLLPPLLERLDRLHPRGRPNRRNGSGDGHGLRVVDLGSGTGANVRWLAPRLPHPERQHWTLVDHDPALLARGPVDATALRADVTDLAQVLTEIGGADLVTAAALLDLLDGVQVTAVVDAVVEAGLPALFALSVDGRVTLDPEDPDDVPVGEAFDAHQRRDDRLGPGATRFTADLFRGRGWRVLEVPTPWRLDPRAGDATLVGSWLEGRAEAAAEARPGLGPDAQAWLARRRAMLADGLPSAVVGHVDLLALPRR